MLVRCIVLSLDRFESQTEDVKGESPMEIIWFQRNLMFSSLLMGLSVLLCVCACTSGGGTVRMLPAVLHGQSGEPAVLPFQTHQHH